MDNWEEIKTAYTVGLLGTISAASQTLGVHRTTVQRHVDSLEEQLGQKLFVRHTNGYKPTNAGKELIRVVKITDEQFHRLTGRIKGQSKSISGELIITSLDALAPLLMPAIKEFHKTYPETTTVFISTEKVLRIEYGEAHIALRPGKKPDTEDNEILNYGTLKFGLFATQEYISEYGQPKDFDELKKHKIIGRYDHVRTFFERWINDKIPPEQIIFKFTTPFIAYQAILNHIGIGVLPTYILKEHPSLVEILPVSDKWHIPLWLIIHRDMYRTEKIQAFLSLIDRNNLIKE